MIAPFVLSLSVIAATVTQDPAAPAPTAPAATPTYEADVACLAVFTIARGVLRRQDPRQDQIAVVRPALQARIDGYLAEGVRDEAQFAVDIQAATNAHRNTFEVELPACLERDAPQP